MAELTPGDKVGKVSKTGEKVTIPSREGLFAYFRNSWVEFKKVVWPERSDATKMTVFVVIFVAVLAAFIYIVDAAISWLFFDLLLKRG